MERITRFRAIAMLLVFATILGLFGVRLYSIQMKGGGSVVIKMLISWLHGCG